MTELTAELIVDGRSPRNPALSPDGKRLAYVLGDEIWLLTGRVAAGSQPRWSADSATLFYLTGDVPQLHRLGGGGLTDWPAGISDHLPLADPALVALVAEDVVPEPDPIVVGEHEPRARLRLLDLRTGVITTPDVFHDRHVVELRQRPDGGPLAVLTQASADLDHGPRTGELHLFDPVTGTAEDLGPAEVDARSLAWWPDGDDWCLGYLALTPPGLQAGTAVFEVTRGNLTAGETRCPTELCQTGAAPLIVFADGLDTTLARLDPDGLTTLSRHPGRLEGLSGGGPIAALVAGRYEPVDVHLGPPEGPLRRVTHTRPELDGVTFGSQERLSYRAADGLELDGLLVLPPAGTGPFPLVTIAHGGPYDRYADHLQLAWHPSAQWLATAGFAVFLPNPRGGQGHGHEFAARVAGRVGQEEWTDIMTGIDLLVDRGVADPERLGIAGWSHGGFLAAWAVGQTGRFRAALAGAGVTDWGMLAATGENGRFEAALGGSTGWSGVGPHPHDAVSPISYASRIRTPVLIVHGAEDTNVPLGQAVHLHRALRHFGAEHEFVIYPREGHRFREREHQLDLLRRTRAWFQSRL